MAAFFVVNVTIPNKEDRADYDEYIARVKPIVEANGGEYLVRSERVQPFAGDAPDRVIVIRFESREKLDACFASPEYQEVKRLRENSVQTTAFVVEQ